VVELPAARDAPRHWLLDGKRGIDRTEQIKSGELAQVRDNFKTVADDFIERYAKRHQRNWQVTKKIIDQKLVKRSAARSTQDATAFLPYKSFIFPETIDRY